MSGVLENMLVTDPAALAAAYAPLLAGASVWIFFYIKYDRNVLRKLELTFQRIVRQAEDLEDCRAENLEALDGIALDDATREFQAAWKKMKGQAERRYTEEIIPEGSSFFREDALIVVPAHRSSVRTIWGVSMLLMLLSVLLPPVVEIVRNGETEMVWFSIGLIPAVLILVGLLLFIGLDRLAYNRALEAYQKFLYAFDTVLPTADAMAGPALLLDASRKNQKAFEAAAETMTAAFSQDTEKIAAAIDEFSRGGVLPALHNGIREMTEGYLVPALNGIKDTLDRTLAQIVEKQESGIREFTDSFAARLADTLELRMNGIADALSRYQNRMEEQNTLYQNRIDALNDILSRNMQELTVFMEKQKEILSGSAEVLDHAAGLYQFEMDQEAKRNEHEGKMLQIVDGFREQTESFARESLTFAIESGKAQQTFKELVTAITEQMQEALAAAGREIGMGINRTVEENAKAIAELTEQAQLLRGDYDVYFRRKEQSTKLMLEEIDYQMQGLITRMSEDVVAMMKETVEANGAILSQYKDQTAELLQSFDEQARSLGLYAREINMDVSELSQNLKTSVAEFNEKIREGIQVTIGDFDRGLAELASRIANTVDGIADAVENLPASLQARTGKKE